jgi:hypothetical protein
MAEPDPYEYRILRIPRGTDIDGAVVQLHVDADTLDGERGLVTMDIRVPARQAGEDWTRDAMTVRRKQPG